MTHSFGLEAVTFAGRAGERDCLWWPEFDLCSCIDSEWESKEIKLFLMSVGLTCVTVISHFNLESC